MLKDFDATMKKKNRAKNGGGEEETNPGEKRGYKLSCFKLLLARAAISYNTGHMAIW